MPNNNFIIISLLALLLTGCALGDFFRAREPYLKSNLPPEQRYQYEEPKAFRLQKVKFTQLPDYSADHPQSLLVGLLSSCNKYQAMDEKAVIGTNALPILARDWQQTCRVLEQSLTKYGRLEQELFEKLFIPYLVVNGKKKTGLFTGYYEAELQASRIKSTVYRYPIYQRPPDLVKDANGKFQPYHNRGQIDNGALEGKGLELFWAKDRLDVFILHIQGSGKLLLDDGSVVRIGYDGNNGYSYRSVARKMISDGLITNEQSDWDGIRGWLERNPDKALNVLAYNQRYVFFKLSTHQLSIVGAQGTPLLAGRSMAVDKNYIPLGSILWVDIKNIPDAGPKRIRRFMLAQDTGNAIKGIIRGDFFWGSGNEALRYAGRMKNEGSYYVLLPIIAVQRFGNIPVLR
ncbi:MAG: MltA domain-containing protein [Alphaproteobacteria bacterium]|nr:MltA domain-containing protein [Alphaproteobacteria bacterium]